MKITFDKEADAAYIYVTADAESVAKTISLSDTFNLDLDAQGRAIGIEILEASKHVPPAALASAENL